MAGEGALGGAAAGASAGGTIGGPIGAGIGAVVGAAFSLIGSGGTAHGPGTPSRNAHEKQFTDAVYADRAYAQKVVTQRVGNSYCSHASDPASCRRLGDIASGALSYFEQMDHPANPPSSVTPSLPGASSVPSALPTNTFTSSTVPTYDYSLPSAAYDQQVQPVPLPTQNSVTLLVLAGAALFLWKGGIKL